MTAYKWTTNLILCLDEQLRFILLIQSGAVFEQTIYQTSAVTLLIENNLY